LFLYFFQFFNTSNSFSFQADFLFFLFSKFLYFFLGLFAFPLSLPSSDCFFPVQFNRGSCTTSFQEKLWMNYFNFFGHKSCSLSKKKFSSNFSFVSNPPKNHSLLSGQLGQISKVFTLGAGATFDWLFFDNSKVINFDD
jgi:hypothetical protein